MSHDSSRAQRSYNVYCDAINLHFAAHVTTDTIAFAVAVILTIYFVIKYHNFIHPKKSIDFLDEQQAKTAEATNATIEVGATSPCSNDLNCTSNSTFNDLTKHAISDNAITKTLAKIVKEKRFTNIKRRRYDSETITTAEFRRNIKICMIILLLFSITLFSKLLNHIFCSIDASFTTICGILFVVFYAGSLTGAMCSFAIKLKSTFAGTIHEPSNKLYMILMASTVMFVTIGIMGGIAFALAQRYLIGENIIDILVTVFLTVDFILYIVVIASTVGLFVSTLKKVKLSAFVVVII